MASYATVKTFPFALGDGQNVTEADWRDMTQRFASTGVVEGEGSQFVTDPGTGLSVTVHPGHAWLIGHYVKSENDETLTLQAADASNPRIDLLVAYVDMVNREGGLKIIPGTAAASPVAPTPTQVEGAMWEEPLFEIYVAAGATSLSASDITDRRTYAITAASVNSALETHEADASNPHQVTAAQVGADITIIGNISGNGCVRYDTGVQICYDRALPITAGYGSTTWTYAAAFAYTPTVIAVSDNTSGKGTAHTSAQVWGTATTAVFVGLYDTGGGEPAGEVQVIAIGYWKPM